MNLGKIITVKRLLKGMIIAYSLDAILGFSAAGKCYHNMQKLDSEMKYKYTDCLKDERDYEKGSMYLTSFIGSSSAFFAGGFLYALKKQEDE